MKKVICDMPYRDITRGKFDYINNSYLSLLFRYINYIDKTIFLLKNNHFEQNIVEELEDKKIKIYREIELEISNMYNNSLD